MKRRFCLWGTLSHNNKNFSVLFNPRFTSRKTTRNLLSPLKRAGLLSLPHGHMLKCGYPNAGVAHVCWQESCSYLVLSRWHATTDMWKFRNLGWFHHPLNKVASVTGGCGCQLEGTVWKKSCSPSVTLSCCHSTPLWVWAPSVIAPWVVGTHIYDSYTSIVLLPRHSKGATS